MDPIELDLHEVETPASGALPDTGAIMNTQLKNSPKGPSTNTMRTLGFYISILFRIVWAKYSSFKYLNPLSSDDGHKGRGYATSSSH